MEPAQSKEEMKSLPPMSIVISATGVVTKTENIHTFGDLVVPPTDNRQLFVVLPTETLEFGPSGAWHHSNGAVVQADVQAEPYISVVKFLSNATSLSPSLLDLDQRVAPLLQVCGQFHLSRVSPEWNVMNNVSGKHVRIVSSDYPSKQKIVIHVGVDVERRFLARETKDGQLSVLEVLCSFGHIAELESSLFAFSGICSRPKFDLASLVIQLLKPDARQPQVAATGLSTLQSALLALPGKRAELMGLSLTELLAMSGALHTASHVIDTMCANKCEIAPIYQDGGEPAVIIHGLR